MNVGGNANNGQNQPDAGQQQVDEGALHEEEAEAAGGGQPERFTLA